MKFKHHELVDSLAKYLDYPCGIYGKGVFSLRNFSLGEQNRAGHADVVTLNSSYSNSLFTIYEVKASKSDFKSDLNSGKYLKYLDVCNRLFFAAPSGIISKSDLPDGIGLMSFDKDKGWRCVKKGAVKQISIDHDILLKFIWCNDKKRVRVRNLAENKIIKENGSLRDRARWIGREIAEAVQNRDDVYWKKEYDNLLHDHEKAKKELTDILEVHASWSWVDRCCSKIQDIKMGILLYPMRNGGY